MGMIDIRGVSFAYPSEPDHIVLDDLTCEIAEGSFVGLVGGTGAGKTSFCRLIPGFIPHHFDGPFRGQVEVDGIDVTKAGIGEVAARVGFVFESPFDQLTGASTTVLEEVAFSLENLGTPPAEIRARVDEALETVGIGQLRDRHPARLSGGQCQRLAIASIIAMRPSVLVLDEPTSQLDPLGSEEVMEVISRMHGQGFTIVLSTKELGTAAPYLDRLIAFDAGRIVADGDPREIIATLSPEASVIRPETVTVSLALGEHGLVDPDAPLPLTVEEVAAQLRPTTRTAVPHSDPPPPARAAVTIQTEAITHRYPGDVLALDGIDLDLDAGCICFLGQNGAGKTTFVKHLNALLRPTSGEVRVAGDSIADDRVAQVARKVALAFQNPDDQLFKGSVEAELRFGARNLGHSEERVDELVTEALELLDLAAHRDAKPYELGLAQRKRVAVASVVAMDTPVVILDEPTGAQDGHGNALFGRLVRRLVEAGKLVLVITHDVEFANAYADRIVVLHQGTVLCDGTPREVFADADLLARTYVQPPVVTRLADALGLDVVVSIDELLACLQPTTSPTLP